MYTNVGGKIKGVAVFACWVGIIISCSLGLVSIYNGYIANQTVYKGTGTVLIIEGIIILAGGCIASWLGSLLIYGFGELIENSGIIAKDLKKMSNGQKSSSGFEYSSPVTETKNTYASNKPPIDTTSSDTGNAPKRFVKEPPKEYVKPIHVEGDPENVTCPRCGIVQPYRRNVCLHCGVGFDKSSSR